MHTFRSGDGQWLKKRRTRVIRPPLMVWMVAATAMRIQNQDRVRIAVTLVVSLFFLQVTA
jgi:hypothetical protein